MGVDYIYLNHDKEQYFHHGLWVTNARSSALGSGPGARALALLLSIGIWSMDRISVVSDISPEYEAVAHVWTDIEVEAELLLLEVDGVDWLEEEIEQLGVKFRRACEYAIYMEHPELIQLLNLKFGTGKWRKPYQEYICRNTPIGLQKIITAKERGLKLLSHR